MPSFVIYNFYAKTAADTYRAKCYELLRNEDFVKARLDAPWQFDICDQELVEGASNADLAKVHKALAYGALNTLPAINAAVHAGHDDIVEFLLLFEAAICLDFRYTGNCRTIGLAMKEMLIANREDLFVTVYSKIANPFLVLPFFYEELKGRFTHLIPREYVHVPSKESDLHPFEKALTKGNFLKAISIYTSDGISAQEFESVKFESLPIQALVFCETMGWITFRRDTLHSTYL